MSPDSLSIVKDVSGVYTQLSHEEIDDELRVFFNCIVACDIWCAASLASILHNNVYKQTIVMDVFSLCVATRIVIQLEE
jgi:hypothetical protein